jgi:hypothetical protein
MDWSLLIGFVVGTLVPLLLLAFLPKEKFHGWGVKVGARFSAAGTKFAGISWESLENNLTGSFVAFAKGLEEGADSDD